LNDTDLIATETYGWE